MGQWELAKVKTRQCDSHDSRSNLMIMTFGVATVWFSPVQRRLNNKPREGGKTVRAGDEKTKS